MEYSSSWDPSQIINAIFLITFQREIVGMMMVFLHSSHSPYSIFFFSQYVEK